jgi:hypothetical protein
LDLFLSCMLLFFLSAFPSFPQRNICGDLFILGHRAHRFVAIAQWFVHLSTHPQPKDRCPGFRPRKKRPLDRASDRTAQSQTAACLLRPQISDPHVPCTVARLYAGWHWAPEAARLHSQKTSRLVVLSEKLGVLDRPGCRLLGAGNHEFRHRRPAQGREACDCLLLLWRNAAFQTLHFPRASINACGVSYGLLPDSLKGCCRTD